MCVGGGGSAVAGKCVSRGDVGIYVEEGGGEENGGERCSQGWEGSQSE